MPSLILNAKPLQQGIEQGLLENVPCSSYRAKSRQLAVCQVPLQSGTQMQAQLAALAGELGVIEDANVLEELNQGPEKQKPLRSQEPTMMSREARQLVVSGAGQAGLDRWKVH